jgi:hypothetical protein
MVQPASAIVLNRLGASQESMLDFECQMPTVINPSKCRNYQLPKLPKNVKCAFSEMCTGVECCSSLDLKVRNILSIMKLKSVLHIILVADHKCIELIILSLS